MDYKEEILDHYKNPRNFGELADASCEAQGANASCGDMLKMQLKIEKEIITKVAWKGVGCALSTAAASMLSEELIGKSVDEVRSWSSDKMKELLGEINPGRVKCVNLPFVALQNALKL